MKPKIKRLKKGLGGKVEGECWLELAAWVGWPQMTD